jgi:hypothetical protein
MYVLFPPAELGVEGHVKKLSYAIHTSAKLVRGNDAIGFL